MTEPGGGDQTLFNKEIQNKAVTERHQVEQQASFGYLGQYISTENATLREKALGLLDQYNIEGDHRDELGVTKPTQWIDDIPTPAGDRTLTIQGQFHDTGKPYVVAYQNPNNPQEVFLVKGRAQERQGLIGIDSVSTFVPEEKPLLWTASQSLPEEYNDLSIVAAFSDIPRSLEQPSSATESPATTEVKAIPYEHRQILNLIDTINNPNTTKDDLEDALHQLRAQLLPNERLGFPRSQKNAFDEIPLPDSSPKHPTKTRGTELTTRIIGEDPSNNVPIYQELVLAVMNGNLVLLRSNSENTIPSPLQEIPDFSSAGRWQYEQLPYLMNNLNGPKTPPRTLLVGHITRE